MILLVEDLALKPVLAQAFLDFPKIAMAGGEPGVAAPEGTNTDPKERLRGRRIVLVEADIDALEVAVYVRYNLAFSGTHVPVTYSRRESDQI
jgi:hypothetical protein